MRAKGAISIFVIICACMLLVQCFPDKPDRKERVNPHPMIGTSGFNKLSRVEQVAVCAGCHRDVYENEMKGPHANAYINLQKHLNYINDSAYDCSVYRLHANNHVEACTRCHTGENLYETVFKEKPTAFSLLQAKSGLEVAPPLRDVKSVATGVDCITCHYNGSSVLSTGNYKKSTGVTGNTVYCSPTPSRFFTGNFNCYPCHSEQVKNLHTQATETHTTEVACNTCHGEKGKKGQSVHYTYWAHNPADKPMPQHLNMFNGISCTLMPDGKSVRVLWENKRMPHVVSVCTELVAALDIRIADETVMRDTINLNRKKDHAKECSPLPGAYGTAFTGINDSLVKIIRLPVNAQGKTVSVNLTGYKKEQYWLNDSINTVYSRKNFILQQGVVATK